MVLAPLVEEFLIHLRHERGNAEHTQRTYAHLLGQFLNWPKSRVLELGKEVKFSDLMAFLDHQRTRPSLAPSGKASRLSSASLYLHVAALRAFFRFAES